MATTYASEDQEKPWSAEILVGHIADTLRTARFDDRSFIGPAMATQQYAFALTLARKASDYALHGQLEPVKLGEAIESLPDAPVSVAGGKAMTLRQAVSDTILDMASSTGQGRGTVYEQLQASLDPDHRPPTRLRVHDGPNYHQYQRLIQRLDDPANQVSVAARIATALQGRDHGGLQFEAVSATDDARRGDLLVSRSGLVTLEGSPNSPGSRTALRAGAGVMLLPEHTPGHIEHGPDRALAIPEHPQSMAATPLRARLAAR